MKTKGTRKRAKTPATLRNACDALLTPIIKLIFPYCLLCGKLTEVAHHHVHKSKSSRLRYELDNLIPLCNHCHRTLHYNESYWASKIVVIRGLEWFARIERIKNEEVRTNAKWYQTNLTYLQGVLNDLR